MTRPSTRPLDGLGDTDAGGCVEPLDDLSFVAPALGGAACTTELGYGARGRTARLAVSGGGGRVASSAKGFSTDAGRDGRAADGLDGTPAASDGSSDDALPGDVDAEGSGRYDHAA